MKTIALVLGTSAATAVVASSIFLLASPSPPPQAEAQAPAPDGRVGLLEKKLAAVERRVGAMEAPQVPAVRARARNRRQAG